MIRVYPPDNEISDDGIYVIFDPKRSRWLSATRPILSFCINHTSVSDGRWLQHHNTPSNINGYLLPRQFIITSLTFKSKNVATGVIKLLSIESGVCIEKYELQINNTDSTIVNDINVEFGLSICAKIEDGIFDYPSLLIETAYIY